MGRGRQKAKQTKVARQLKYFSPETDYDALQRELASSNGQPDRYTEDALDEADEDGLQEDDGEADEYADWAPNRKH
jgi:hypothetical protein